MERIFRCFFHRELWPRRLEKHLEISSDADVCCQRRDWSEDVCVGATRSITHASWCSESDKGWVTHTTARYAILLVGGCGDEWGRVSIGRWSHDIWTQQKTESIGNLAFIRYDDWKHRLSDRLWLKVKKRITSKKTFQNSRKCSNINSWILREHFPCSLGSIAESKKIISRFLIF